VVYEEVAGTGEVFIHHSWGHYQVIAIARQRRLILAGVLDPSGPTDAASCSRCEYLTECSSNTASHEAI
jgi:hypothetical protein